MTTPTTFRDIGKPRRVREDRRFVAGKGRYVADVKLDALSQAERRRAAVEERAERQARVVAKGSEAPSLGGKRKTGTGLE